MARSLQQQIDDNDAAIARCEVSQEHTDRGRTNRLAELRTLYAERDRLATLQANQSRSPFRLAKIDRVKRELFPMSSRNDAAVLEFLDGLEKGHSTAATGQRRTGRRDNFFALGGGDGSGALRGGFTGAKRDRLSQDWDPGNASPNLIHRFDGMLRERARDLALNNPIARSGIGAWIANVIEGGIKPRPLFTAAADRAAWLKTFNRWAKREADITGHQHFYELQGLWLEEILVAGGCIAHYVPLAPKLQRRVGLSIELIPEERFADDHDNFIQWQVKKKSANPISAGVEYDMATGRVVQYWVRPTVPNDIHSVYEKPFPIRADRADYSFFKHRIGQYRGYSVFAAAMTMLWKLAYYTDNEMISSAIRSLFTVAVSMDQAVNLDGLLGDDEDPASTDTDGNLLERLQSGIIVRCKPGEKVTPIGPSIPPSDPTAWLHFCQRLIGVALDLSFDELMRDGSQANFGSLLATHNADIKRFTTKQDFTVNHFCEPALERFSMAAALQGLDGLPTRQEMVSDFEEWTEMEWETPGWRSSNPLDDARADDIKLKNGSRTRAKIISGEGGNWEDTFQQLEKEQELAGLLGINVAGAPTPAAGGADAGASSISLNSGSKSGAGKSGQKGSAGK